MEKEIAVDRGSLIDVPLLQSVTLPGGLVFNLPTKEQLDYAKSLNFHVVAGYEALMAHCQELQRQVDKAATQAAHQVLQATQESHTAAAMNLGFAAEAEFLAAMRESAGTRSWLDERTISRLHDTLSQELDFVSIYNMQYRAQLAWFRIGERSWLRVQPTPMRVVGDGKLLQSAYPTTVEVVDFTFEALLRHISTDYSNGEWQLGHSTFGHRVKTLEGVIVKNEDLN